MKIAVEPFSRPEFDQAIEAGGGDSVKLSDEVTSLIWTDYSRPDLLRQVIDENPQLRWVQLPFAGVDAFSDIIQRSPIFTSAKGAYSEPVAEHALALALALGRALPKRLAAKSWGEKFAVSLYESQVLIVGAGGIARELCRLLEPFGCEVVCLGSAEIAGLDAELASADFVILACALTPKTKYLFDARRFKIMKRTAFLVNVARGAVVVTDDLVSALNDGEIAGAGVDVTDPEPLPDGHPLWNASNIIITPHTADTDAQVIRMFAERIRINVEALRRGQPFIGVVNKELGY